MMLTLTPSLNKPVLLHRVNEVLGLTGKTGTLYKSLKAVADRSAQKSSSCVLQKRKSAKVKTQSQLEIGGTEPDGTYTGMYALLVAEQDERIGYRPRILSAPDLDTEEVTSSLCVIAEKLRAFVYAWVQRL